MILKRLKSQRGTAFVELSLISIFLVLIFCAGLEMGSLIHAQMGVTRVVREGAREAVLTGDTSTGYSRARECAEQCLGSSTDTTIRVIKNDNTVVCTASYEHKTLEFLSKNGIGENRTLKATAVYSWWDET